VSIVNWLKGTETGLKRLYSQKGNSVDSPWEMHDLLEIGASLSSEANVSSAATLQANVLAEVCYQGQTHGHEGFLLTPSEALSMLAADKTNAKIVHPFLIGDDLLGTFPPRPSRYVIDLYPRSLADAVSFKLPFARIKERVLPDREAAAAREEARSREALADDPRARLNHHHANFLKRWWCLSYPRAELMEKLRSISRYVACSAVTKRPVFEFVDPAIHPNAALIVFLFDDDYSFGILQSSTHWQWFTARCSTLEERPRYTSETVFSTFPWPQAPTTAQVRNVAEAGRALRAKRRTMMERGGLTFRELYRLLELPGESELKDAQLRLDKAVALAYGFKMSGDYLAQLLKLNALLAAAEKSGRAIVGPGLPPSAPKRSELVTQDRVTLLR
jgi:hypothetical protein